MANINFGLLDTQYPEKLANALVRSPEQQNANMLQVMQMQQLMDQREQAQYALGKSRREETGLAAFGEGLRALGPDPDPDAVAQLFIKHPDKAMQQAGVEMLQKAREAKRYAEVNAPGPAFGGGAPESFGAEVATRKAQLFGPPPGRTNMMPGAAVAPAEVNNLPAAFTPPQVNTQIDSLRARIDANLALGTDKGYKTAENLQKQLTELTKLYPLGSVLMSGTGAIVGTAPAAPSEFEKLLKDSGLTTEQQNVYRTAKLNKDTAIAQPEFIDNLRALAATKDPTERKFLTDRLIYMTAHPPGTNVKVNAYMPASEEAQRDFMKSTRATYDTLKQSPSMFANIEASKKLIPAASVFMGTGGEGMKAAASFLNNRLGMNVNTEGVKTAEELRSRLFQGILANLKRLDSQPSERQQAALEQALGSLNTDPNALSNVLDSYADTVRTNIDTHNAEVQSAISRGVKFPYDPIIKVPAKANAPEVWVRDASGKLVKQ